MDAEGAGPEEEAGFDAEEDARVPTMQQQAEPGVFSSGPPSLQAALSFLGVIEKGGGGAGLEDARKAALVAVAVGAKPPRPCSALLGFEPVSLRPRPQAPRLPSLGARPVCSLLRPG